MKLFVAATALAAVLAAPALAQTPPPAPEAKSGEITVQGVEPSKVLGAIDTSKLATENAAEAKVEAQASADVQPEPQAPLAKSADAQGVTTKPDPNDKTHSDVQSAASGSVGVQTASLPQEVEAAVSDGKYNTKDLVQAQLEAVRNSPVSVPTTVTTTTIVTPAPEAASAPESGDSPVFDRATRPGDWSQSAGTTEQPG